MERRKRREQWERLKKTIGVQEACAIAGVAMVGLGLGAIYLPLAPIWGGVAILYAVRLSLSGGH